MHGGLSGICRPRRLQRIGRAVAAEASAQSRGPLARIDPAMIALDDRVLRGPSGQSQTLVAALASTPTGEIEMIGEFRHPAPTDKMIRTTFEGGCGTAGPVTPKFAMFAFGAEMAEVHINRWTHEIRVPRLHGAFAAGTILARKPAHSRLLGGTIWGIGSALHEATETDIPLARFLNAGLAEYLIAVNADVREVRVEMLDEQDDCVDPLGVKGIGELGTIGTAAANAVHHATGKRLYKLPIRISDLVRTDDATKTGKICTRVERSKSIARLAPSYRRSSPRAGSRSWPRSLSKSRCSSLSPLESTERSWNPYFFRGLILG